MGMDGGNEAQQTFEAMRPDLVRSDPGRFALVCGDSLLGVYSSVDEALFACSRAFDDRTLPEGAPVLISEIAERVSVRVMARPYRRADKTDGAVSGEI